MNLTTVGSRSNKMASSDLSPANGSWFNGEEQHYTDRDENSYVENGTLKICNSRKLCASYRGNLSPLHPLG